MAGATLVSSVSTTAVPAADRLAFWEQYNDAALVGLTCSTFADDGLLARQDNLDLGGVRIADIAGNAHVIERAPRLVRSRPKDATFLSLLLEGEAFFYTADGCIRLSAGDLLVYDTDRPYLFGFGTSMRQVLVDVPRALFTERCGVPSPVRPRRFSGHDAGAPGLAVRALRRRLLGVVAAPGECPSEEARDELLDVARTVLADPASAPGAAHRLAAKAYVAERLADPRLSPDGVARAVGVSVRHLNRAFAAEGTTVAQYVQARRLDHAREELAAPDAGVRRIADVAARWGFASQAHFARQFRARFGCAPSEIRPGRVTGG